MRVLVGCLLLLALAATPALADQTHIVQPGETLWVIASRHGVSVNAIARANRLDDVDLLQPGQRLVIPASGSTPMGTKPGRTSAARASAPRLLRYEVRAGDNLWALARRFDMGVEDLAALNGIAVESTLRIGQVQSAGPGRPGRAQNDNCPRGAPYGHAAVPGRGLGEQPDRSGPPVHRHALPVGGHGPVPL